MAGAAHGAGRASGWRFIIASIVRTGERTGSRTWNRSAASATSSFIAKNGRSELHKSQDVIHLFVWSSILLRSFTCPFLWSTQIRLVWAETGQRHTLSPIGDCL